MIISIAITDRYTVIMINFNTFLIADQAEKFGKDLDNWNNTRTMIEGIYRNHYIQSIEIQIILIA